MMSIFNGTERGLGTSKSSIWMKLDVEFRTYLKHFKGAKLHVFLDIALHADANGFARPSYDRIREHTGYGRDTIGTALSGLTETLIHERPILIRWRERDPSTQQFVSGNYYVVFPVDDQILEVYPDWRVGTVPGQTPLMENADSGPELENTNSGKIPTLEKADDGKCSLEVDPIDQVDPDFKENQSIIDHPSARAATDDDDDLSTSDQPSVSLESQKGHRPESEAEDPPTARDQNSGKSGVDSHSHKQTSVTAAGPTRSEGQNTDQPPKVDSVLLDEKTVRMDDDDLVSRPEITVFLNQLRPKVLNSYVDPALVALLYDTYGFEPLARVFARLKPQKFTSLHGYLVKALDNEQQVIAHEQAEEAKREAALQQQIADNMDYWNMDDPPVVPPTGLDAGVEFYAETGALVDPVQGAEESGHDQLALAYARQRGATHLIARETPGQFVGYKLHHNGRAVMELFFFVNGRAPLPVEEGQYPWGKTRLSEIPQEAIPVNEIA